MKPDLVPDYIKYDTPVKKIQTINPKNTLPKNTTNIKNNDIGFIFNIIIVFIILGVSFIVYLIGINQGLWQPIDWWKLIGG